MSKKRQVMDRYRIRHLIILLALLACGFLLRPRATDRAGRSINIDLGEIDPYIQEQVEKFHIPGLAVTVVRGGEVIFEKGYGEASPGRAMTVDTLLYIGSVTKSFTALAVMKLIEEGKLSLDAPVQDYLPWFRVADEQVSARITVRHLLNHTSGLSERGDPHGGDRPASLLEQALLLRGARPTAEPGRQFQYYNQNYRLLGLLVEEVSGLPFAEYLRLNIFDPLGMEHTYCDPADAAGLAQGYSQAFGFPVAMAQPFQPAALPSGYVISSAGDMAHFMIAMLSETRFGDEQIVNKETLAAMFTPPAGIGSDYGMGWLAGVDEGIGRFYFMSGALETFHAEVLLVPGEDLGVAFLANQGGLIPIYLGFPYIIRFGIIKMLGGSNPVQSPFTLVILLMRVMLVVYFGVEIYCFWKLPCWGRNLAALRPLHKYAVLSLIIMAPISMVIGLPATGRMLGGGKSGWAVLYSLQPDLTAWLLAVLFLFLVKGVVLTWLAEKKKDRIA